MTTLAGISAADPFLRFALDAAITLRRLPPLPGPARLAYAIRGFQAGGFISLPLLEAANDPAEQLSHRMVNEIAGDAIGYLTDSIGPAVAARYRAQFDPDTRVPAAGELDGGTRTRLRQAARDAATTTRELLAALRHDESALPDVRADAEDMHSGADLIATIYDDDPRKAHLGRETFHWARQQQAPLPQTPDSSAWLTRPYLN
jgi:acyl-CoA reductase-like NAD-dependent aldehyde dehydrogenase